VKTSASPKEREADEAIQKVLRALDKATELAERAGYGQEVQIPLAEAHKNVRYAHDVALGRN
jgi:hypothetical protein